MEPKSKLKLLKIRVRKIFSSLLTKALKLFFEAPFLKQIIPKRKLKWAKETLKLLKTLKVFQFFSNVRKISFGFLELEAQ